MSGLTVHQIKRSLFIFFLALLIYPGANAQRPNIIYIMTDDMGYGDLSGYGQKNYTTPNLDKLASQGVKFVNAYSAAPICTPARTAFMTGRYPARTPVGLIEPLTTTPADSSFGLTAEYPSIASLMKNAGYETALIGKWHLGSLPRHSPNRNGFDYFFGFLTGAADYVSHRGDKRGHDLYENESLVYPEGYLTDLFSEKAVTFIRKKHDAPFFLAVTYNAPHWPWQGPKDKPYPDTTGFRNGGSREIYAAMMKSLDDGIGNIMKALDDEQLDNQTIVIFTNDNGGEKYYSDNGGLTNVKGTLWEGGIRVPAFVRWPGKIAAGTITTQAAITMDWTATILSMGNGVANKDFALDGMNLMPILIGESKTIDRTFCWRTFQRTKHKAILEGNWKYLKDEKGEYLFNLATDQEEKMDVKAKEAAVFNKLKEKFATWEKTVLNPVSL
jgi:arylsulfatase A-like enzyme